jgi:hypothetical protein
MRFTKLIRATDFFPATMLSAVKAKERKKTFLRELPKQQQREKRARASERKRGKIVWAKKPNNETRKRKKFNFDVKNHRARNCGMNEGEFCVSELPQLLRGISSASRV